MKTTVQFIRMLEPATLRTQFSPKELEAFRNPQEISSSPLDDPNLLLSISNYVANLNASQDIYTKSRLNIQRRNPDMKILSYDQVQRRISKLSGVVTCISKCSDRFFTFPRFSRAYFSSVAYSSYLCFLLFSDLL